VSFKASELSDFVLVHSGTTLQNYQTCAYLVDGSVIFDKQREPRHTHQLLYYLPTFGLGIRYFAFEVARKLGHIPCVMEGAVRKDLEHCIKLPKGEFFVVKRVWVPNIGNWESLDSMGQIDDNFRAFDAKDLLLK